MSQDGTIASVPVDRLRVLERCLQKLSNRKASVLFNTVCINERLCPKYILKYKKNRCSAGVQYDSSTKSILDRERLVAEAAIDGLTRGVDDISSQLLNEFPTLQKTDLCGYISRVVARFDAQKRIIITKKLSQLYGPSFVLRDEEETFINLSSYNPTEKERRFLNLGYSYQIPGRYDPLRKQCELEILYQQIARYRNTGFIKTTPRLRDMLRIEGHTHRNAHQPRPKWMMEAAQSLRANTDIIIRRADKSSSYVLLDRSAYFSGIDELLSDGSKFERVSRDPTSSIKTRVNCVVTKIGLPFRQLIGDYKPGYIYCNVKSHKPGFPLRPIISQCCTPVHEVAQTLVTIIKKYCPSTYRLSSTNEFLQLIRQRSSTNCSMVSLDVTSLFTNVPVQATIDIICRHVYHHSSLSPPTISETHLVELLRLCTTEMPFLHPNGKMFKQIDGVAMGSPLGPLFADYYMGELESRVIPAFSNDLIVYGRYVDDIFVLHKNTLNIDDLKADLEKNSVLKFTTEFPSSSNLLPFLDVMVSNIENTLHFQPYVKPSNNGECLRGDSYCTDRTKRAVILGYLRRAHEASEDMVQFNNSITRIRSVLINNGYTNQMLDQTISVFQNKIANNSLMPRDNVGVIRLFYRAQMHEKYQKDERHIRDIVIHNVIPKNPALHSVVLNIYYRSTYSRSLIMKNSPIPVGKMKRTNVVYKFICPFPHPVPAVYIGHTRTTLSRRLTGHLQGGGITQHFLQCHGAHPDRSTLVGNTTIIGSDNDPIRLKTLESLYITRLQPSLNTQNDIFFHTLHLFTGACVDNWSSQVQTPPRAGQIPPRSMKTPAKSMRTPPRSLKTPPGSLKTPPGSVRAFDPLPSCVSTRVAQRPLATWQFQVQPALKWNFTVRQTTDVGKPSHVSTHLPLLLPASAVVGAISEESTHSFTDCQLDVAFIDVPSHLPSSSAQQVSPCAPQVSPAPSSAPQVSSASSPLDISLFLEEVDQFLARHQSLLPPPL